MSNRLYIFDADTTLRRCTVPGQFCPNNWNEWEPIPWAHERLQKIDFSYTGFAIASNQGGIEKGYLSKSLAIEMLFNLAQIMTGGIIGTRITVHVCEHESASGCLCRKPKPMMLRDAMAIHGVSQSETIMVGDMASDEQAAVNAGVEFAWIWDFCGKTREEWREHVGYL